MRMRGRLGLEAIARLLTAIIEWMRAGHPHGIPPTDYIQPLAVLSRRLSTEEIELVAHELVHRGDFDHIDIGVAITQITDQLPTPKDIERVRQRLAARASPSHNCRDVGDVR